MSSSRRPARAIPLLAALLAAGCAHLGPRDEAPPAPTAPPATTARAAPRERTARPPDATPRFDPSEEITPEELASIPEPLGNPSIRDGNGVPDSPSEPPAKPAPEPVQPRSPAPDTRTPGEALWRVQILATPDRSLADRVAAEAAERLGSIARVDREGALYKVRLGAFPTESDAQGLRDRAVEMGYPGAFRVKNGPQATDG